MPEPPCECEQPGFCQRYQIYQDPYAWGICTGKGGPGDRPCSPEKSERNKRRWRLQVIDSAKQGPPLPRQVANVTRALVKHALDHFRRTPEEDLKVREAFCLTCEMNSEHANKDLGVCKHKSCGCPLKRGGLLALGMIKPSKLEIASEKCPLGLWGPV